MVKIIESDNLINETEKYDAVLVGTSIYCMLTGGFQSKMRFKYPFLDEENNKLPYGDSRRLGTSLIFTDMRPCISLMYMCKYPNSQRVTVDYRALENCLMRANAEFSGLKVASTVLGTSRFDGNGEREKCLEIIRRCTPNLDLTLYDYVQISRREEEEKLYKYVSSLKETDMEKHLELRKKGLKELYKEYYLA